MARVTFYQVFRVIDKDTLAFISRTRIGGSTFDANDLVRRGLIIAGIDFFKYVGNDMEANDTSDGTTVIERVYVK